MRRAMVVLLVAGVLLAPVSAFAQAPFEDLGLRVNLDDVVRVEDGSGTRVAGRLTRLTLDELAIRTKDGERRFTRSTTSGVAVRTSNLRRGALIGAAAFALLGATAMCAHGEDRCAIVGPLAAAPIGVGVGLAVGALFPRMQSVYRATPDALSAVAPSGTVDPGFLSDVALRANLDDRVTVEDRSGSRTTGRLIRLTAGDVIVRTGGVERRFAREVVRHIAVRRHPLRVAVLTGAAAGVVAGAVAACTGPEKEECFDAPMMAGALGAGVGLAAGSLIHRTETVYPRTGRRVAVIPVLSPGTVRVAVVRRW